MGLLVKHLVVDDIPVELRRNKHRKTRMGLAFDPAGTVIVDAPMDASDSEVRAVVHEHARWLRHRLAKVRSEAACVALPRHESGELVQYLGNAFELLVSAGDPSVSLTHREPQLNLFESVQGIRGRLTITHPEPTAENVRGLLNGWYTRMAHEILGERLAYWRHLPWLDGASPPWRIRFMRSQWGSCSAAGKIALNTHLIKTPRRLIDYVVLHELCHLRHHNHGRRFYGLLTKYMSDWSARSTELDRFLPVLLHE